MATRTATQEREILAAAMPRFTDAALADRLEAIANAPLTFTALEREMFVREAASRLVEYGTLVQARSSDDYDDVRYPLVKVKLTGTDGNAFAVLGRVQVAMRRAGLRPHDIKAYVDEATMGDYDHLLRVTMKTVRTS